MEFNFRSNTHYSYLRYGAYSGKYKEKEYYIVPNPYENVGFGNVYDMFSKIESALVYLLNIGKICLEDDTERTKFTCALLFVEQYGLLGFMTEAPTNSNFMLDKEITLKEGNFIEKKGIIKMQDYFELFFPFSTKDEISYSIVDNKVNINTKSDLQKVLSKTPINDQLIYSPFYAEKVDWIIEYAKKMYRIYKLITDCIESDENNKGNEYAKEVIDNYIVSGVPYKIHMYGNIPEIAWQPNSLKQALDMSFGFFMCSDKNPIKQCKHCGKIFSAKNPKAEYCDGKCRNKANVYKSRNKGKE